MIGIDLTGKTALITGGSTGLGLATASMLCQAGANVVINYLDDGGVMKARSEKAAQDLGPRAMAIAADVRDSAGVKKMIDQICVGDGGLDIIVNNAGIIRDKTLRKMSDAEWQAVIDTNLTGVFNVCRAASENLSDGGRIVNLASISGVMGFYGQANYAAAKAGVIALTKVVSKELAKRAITVNAVAPGVVLTEMGQSIPPEVRQRMLAQIPLGRFGEAAEIASVILFLCSKLGAYVTGQTIHVNGGWWG